MSNRIQGQKAHEVGKQRVRHHGKPRKTNLKRVTLEHAAARASTINAEDWSLALTTGSATGWAK